MLQDSSVGSIFQYMNALLSDRIVENLSTSERQNILTLIARRFEKTKVGLYLSVITITFNVTKTKKM